MYKALISTVSNVTRDMRVTQHRYNSGLTPPEGWASEDEGGAVVRCQGVMGKIQFGSDTFLQVPHLTTLLLRHTMHAV